ncbi:hypothetical protein CVV68_03575 [Arthrobacter livingstonensis]|uniref:Uncharacterized protein n=1 Tax=Arthrobacter livingstonensis TaxID=670078 RepID=A0A2V5LE93_9MICC|nr:hypothetical protein [Arthrobacter livingstonensis]PYI68904.1 hypothetical protein CVV68_03575 [Arthrobacter livingstonensis]
MSEKNHEQLEAELESLLEKVFAADTKEYHKRGFKRRVGCPRGVIGSSHHGAVLDLLGRSVACPQRVAVQPPARGRMGTPYDDCYGRLR